MSFTIMETGRYKVIKPCVDQDTKQRLKPGDLHNFKSDFEKGRHLAEGNVIPEADAFNLERAVSEPTETRKRRTRKKRNEPETHNGSNGK